MKFVRAKKNETTGAPDGFVFHLNRRDKSLLLSILKLFPVTDLQSHRLTKGEHAAIQAGQEWLTEAMGEQRQQNVKRIERLLKNPGQFFRGEDDSLQVVLSGEQLEWLLQALNDVRVGSWMRLGCPEMAEARRAVLNEQTAAHYTAMEVSGYFQNALLDAYRGGEV
jgi:hypothetical protein